MYIVPSPDALAALGLLCRRIIAGTDTDRKRCSAGGGHGRSAKSTNGNGNAAVVSG
jgi:hypothetical protein